MTRVADDKRKKKRAARSRTGCLTCRERRVKCDESKPICQRCLTIGRACRGYEGYALSTSPTTTHKSVDTISTSASFERPRRGSWTSTTGSSSDFKQDTASPQIYVPSPVSSQYSYTVASYSPTSIEQSPVATQHSYILTDHTSTTSEQSMSPESSVIVHQNRQPEHALVQRQTRSQSPASDFSDYQWDAIYYAPYIFDNDTQRAINYFIEKTFPEIGTYFSRGVWAQVPKIAYSEPSIKHSLIALSHFHEQFTTNLVPASALRYYMLAIKELRSGIPTITGILCLMMFFAIELLQKSHSSAMQLLRVARRMMYDIRSDQSDLYHALRHFIRRIDKQVTEISGDIDPTLSYTELWGEEPFKMRGLIAKPVFHSYTDAMDAMASIIEPWLNDPNPDHQVYIDKIQDWQIPFEEWKNSPLDELSRSKIPTVEVFWRHYELAISKARDAPISQTWWDQHETRLSEIVHFLQIDPDLETGTRFGLEHCVIYHLFNIGRECRSPAVRKKILDWMSTLNMQEGMLTVELVSRVLDKVIELEEAGMVVQSSSQIPEHRRIQELSLDLNDDVKKMKYKVNDEWRIVSLRGC